MTPDTLTVSLGDRSYDIHFGKELRDVFGAWLSGHAAGADVFVVTDRNVAAIYGQDIVRWPGKARHAVLAIEPGEERKTWETVREIYTFLARGVDGVFFGDDWGTQNAPIISPKLFREVFKPRYRALMAPIKRAGRKVCFHSCGQLGSIFDDLLDLGIDLLWPQILRYDEEQLATACKEHGVTIYLHPDRQHLMPLGTPVEIDARIAAYAERYHRLGGGCIFYVEIENDAPFENVVALVEAVDRYR